MIIHQSLEYVCIGFAEFNIGSSVKGFEFASYNNNILKWEKKKLEISAIKTRMLTIWWFLIL